jgi:hypothetical protein
MSHQWVFDVLRDLKVYASLNSLPGLAARVDEALVVAQAEISGLAKNANAGMETPLRGNDRPQ